MNKIYEPPYRFEKSEKFFEERDGVKPYWSSYFVSVFDDKDQFIYKFKRGGSKGSSDLFIPFKKNKKWYLLTWELGSIVIYSLPDMNEIASKRISLSVMSAHIPRLWKYTTEIIDDGKKYVYKNALIDDEIENKKDDVIGALEEDWHHADFVLMQMTDRYSACPGLFNVLDISKMDTGEIDFVYSQHEYTPDWLDIHQIVDIKEYDPDYEELEIAVLKTVKTRKKDVELQSEKCI